MARIIFVTGTDTGVGKTIVTGLLLQHLRRRGCHALAVKPFCSGGRGDARLLHALQDRELTLGEVNPFYFDQPLAPLVAARRQGVKIGLENVLNRISRVARGCECLLVEGSGGLFVPLGEGYSVADLIAKLGCPAIVVSRNHLGTINHTLLTLLAMQQAEIQPLAVVLVAQGRPDPSAASNLSILAKLAGDVPVFPLRFLGRNLTTSGALRRAEKKVKKTLAEILCQGMVGTRSLQLGKLKGLKKVEETF
ncbi:MAG TPA: dethiobiotin synthase [Candidatus Acidoferrum sp.]|nr:dethiobiotin synthase [Candidatus Acidoferrum sp.]